MDIYDVKKAILSLIEEKNIKEFAFEITESEKQELNTELTNFSLYRTIFDNAIHITLMDNGKKGTGSGSDFTMEGLSKVVEDAASVMESSNADPANMIAEKQDSEVFHTGPYEADKEAFYVRLKEFMDTIENEYPKVKTLQIIADHTKTHTLYVNSSKTEFEAFEGVYSVSFEGAGNDGVKTTGLSYFGVSTNDLGKPFIELSNIRKRLEDTEKSLNVFPLKGKFEGTMILTPDCLGRFAFMLISNYMGGRGIMDGTSRWKDRLGEKVTSDKVTLSLKAADERLVETQSFTADGYKAENVSLLDKGVLKSHVLDLYSAKKTNRPVTKNTGRAFVMEPGDTPFEEMVKHVKKGIIVGGFSGGHPGANGEFSGVAKNSFYVEDGKILGAVSETMINGNLEDVFNKVIAVSKESVSNGSMVFPYMAVDGIVISGK